MLEKNCPNAICLLRFKAGANRLKSVLHRLKPVCPGGLYAFLILKKSFIQFLKKFLILNYCAAVCFLSLKWNILRKEGQTGG